MLAPYVLKFFVWHYTDNALSFVSFSCQNLIFKLYGSHLKETVNRQNCFYKYAMLRTVTTYSTIIIAKFTWYHRYREMIQLTGGPPLRLHRKPHSKVGMRILKCSDLTWALSRLTRIIVSLERYYLSHFESPSPCKDPSGSKWYACISFMT